MRGAPYRCLNAIIDAASYKHAGRAVSRNESRAEFAMSPPLKDPTASPLRSARRIRDAATIAADDRRISINCYGINSHRPFGQICDICDCIYIFAIVIDSVASILISLPFTYSHNTACNLHDFANIVLCVIEILPLMRKKFRSPLARISRPSLKRRM